MSANEALHRRIQGLVDSDRVVLFMKGSRRMPQCGFSAQVVQILDSLLDDYTTVDVLQDPEIRQGIKEFSSWPTIPQLYVAGEFVGGCDIVTEMYQSGELQEQLGKAEAR
jgi:monothiol glutaredoxin